jgi:hypothetical protein
MKKIFKYGLVGLLVIAPIASISGYYLALNSEPYAVTKSAIIQSNAVRAETGEVKEICLAFFGYFIRYQGPKGTASFRTNVIGEQKAVEVYVDLETNTGKWNVKDLHIASAVRK